MWWIRKSLLCLYLAFLGCGTLLVHAVNYVFDNSKGFGRTFDGIGGISGGGATSKLLVNYPLKLRNEILDYLFKPNFGASLHILKVEIGGDTQSSDGTESSHMHNSWDENYNRGYEWWLMKEAKQRNPNIKLVGLPWGFPGWLGQGHNSPWTNLELTADYIIKWILGAKTHHNLTIDYIGLWNEKTYNSNYIKVLRIRLNAKGLNHVKIIAADEWNVNLATDITHDSQLNASIDVLGFHYPGTHLDARIAATGKDRWASEDYSTFNDESGGGCWARILNQNYVNGYMTSTLCWNLIASYYRTFQWDREGLMTAYEPWSGHYTVSTPIWGSAHTTQFTKPGWRYLQHGFGVGHLNGGGSYVGLTSPDNSELTIVIETMTHDHSRCIRPALPAYTVTPQNITIVLQGKYASIAHLNLWHSKLVANGKSTLFEKRTPVQFHSGQATLAVDVDSIYTLTTLTTGSKGQYDAPPPSKPFPLPYTDNFNNLAVDEEPYNLAQQEGVFEAVNSDAAHGKVVRQVLLQVPIRWCGGHFDKTYNVIGSPDWGDVYVEFDFELGSVNKSKGVYAAVRAKSAGCQSNAATGVFFFVHPQDKTFTVTSDLALTKVITKGTVPALTGWSKLGLFVQGSTARGFINGKEVFSVTALPQAIAAQKGFAALGTDGYGIADFDNLKILSATDAATSIVG